MVTHYPHQIASGNRVGTTRDARRAVDGIVARVRDWLRQSYCGLHGHDTLLQFEKERMFLRCVSCGHETPGWELSDLPRPTVRMRGDVRHHALTRPQLVRARRIA
jgi:hypothetical protein